MKVSIGKQLSERTSFKVFLEDAIVPVEHILKTRLGIANFKQIKFTFLNLESDS